MEVTSILKEEKDKHRWNLYVCGMGYLFMVEMELPYGKLKNMENIMEDIANSFQPLQQQMDPEEEEEEM